MQSRWMGIATGKRKSIKMWVTIYDGISWLAMQISGQPKCLSPFLHVFTLEKKHYSDKSFKVWSFEVNKIGLSYHDS